jgi:hypothetical protein
MVRNWSEACGADNIAQVIRGGRDHCGRSDLVHLRLLAELLVVESAEYERLL